ncbi:TPA_exp: Uncharacterized protein A8136_2792 [Trichophyton benhamiae CBS 112371]|nr:TPA_exp: Uncharacterized protein A8136_2792 [Trichophyton benhamiae CBS 112371]
MGTVLDILPQIPAADPQDGDGDGSSSDSQLGVEAQTQPQPEPTSQLFTAGRLLVFSPLKDNYLLRDKKRRTVPEEFVVFGPEYETVESRKKAALELLWNGLRWEAKFLESEWFIRGNRGNGEIFPPDTADSRVLEAILELEQMAPFQPQPN